MLIRDRVFPIKDGSSFWEKEKKNVVAFKSALPHYFERLSNMLGFSIYVSNDEKYLEELSKVINEKIRSKKLPVEFRECFSMYIGELIRIKTKARWVLRPQKSFNVYYIPELVKDDQYCNHWGYIFSELELVDVKPINIQQVVQDASRFNNDSSKDYLEL